MTQHPANPWPGMWALVLGFFMILVDSTIVTVAMPAIMHGLGADLGGVVWVTSAYLLAYAVPLLITGRLGDRFGPKRLYLTGLTVFTAASVWCGLSGSIEMLILARVAQGFGAAMMSPQTMAIITRTFPPERRGAAMGLWGATAGVATLLGPLVGGLVTDAWGWEWIFFINLPVGVLALVLAWRLVPRLEVHPHRFDWLGVALSGLGMFCLVFGIEEGETYDWGQIWGPISVPLLIVTGVVVLGLFVLWQARMSGEPLVPLGLFRDRNFAAANVAITAMGFIITAQVFPLMFFLQTARGMTPTQAALLGLPTAVLSGFLAPVIGKLIDRHDPKPYAVGGFVLLGASFALYAWLMRPGLSALWLLIPAALAGIANTGIWGPLSVSATRNLPPRMAGAGSGIYNTTRQVGSVLGSAAVAALMQAQIATNLPGGGQSPAGGGMGGGRIPDFLEAGFTTAMSHSLVMPVAISLVGALAAGCLVAKINWSTDQ
ncbi:DHA2 family efflux MFS transporter permease subunit [Mariniluteicoccus flavus]